jgi:hypothetical protein
MCLWEGSKKIPLILQKNTPPQFPPNKHPYLYPANKKCRVILVMQKGIEFFIVVV